MRIDFLNTSKTLIDFSGFLDLKIKYKKLKKTKSIFRINFVNLPAEYLGYSGFSVALAADNGMKIPCCASNISRSGTLI